MPLEKLLLRDLTTMKKNWLELATLMLDWLLEYIDFHYKIVMLGKD